MDLQSLQSTYQARHQALGLAQQLFSEAQNHKSLVQQGLRLIELAGEDADGYTLDYGNARVSFPAGSYDKALAAQNAVLDEYKDKAASLRERARIAQTDFDKARKNLEEGQAIANNAARVTQTRNKVARKTKQVSP